MTVPQSTFVAPAVRVARGPRWAWLILLAAVGIVVLYALAWGQAYRLSNRFMAYANDQYAQGNYLNALSGATDLIFDQATGKYVYEGGYIQAESIWTDQMAWPRPPVAAEAGRRAQEVIDRRLTEQDALQFVQEHTGKRIPYFSRVYFRLGELAQAAHDEATARDVFTSIPSLFPNDPALAARAERALKGLGQ